MFDLLARPVRADAIYPERRLGQDAGLDAYWDGAAGRIQVFFRRRKALQAARMPAHATDMADAEAFKAALAGSRGAVSGGPAAAAALDVAISVAKSIGVAGDVLEAARTPALAMLAGGVAETPGRIRRWTALTLAAAVAAGQGNPVHLVVRRPDMIEPFGDVAQPILQALGLSVDSAMPEQGLKRRRAAYAADVTIASFAGLGSDYLRDRMIRRGRGAERRWRIDRLKGPAADAAALTMRGLACAFVDEADHVLCEAGAAVLQARDRGRLDGDRRLAAEAQGLADQLSPERDFVDDRLTLSGKQRLRLLAAALGSTWAQGRRREALIEQALAASQIGDDDWARDAAGEITLTDAARAALTRRDGVAPEIWVEHIAGDGRGGAVAVALPACQIYRRYVHLGAAAAFAAGHKRELFEAYGLWLHAAPQVVARHPVSHAFIQDDAAVEKAAVSAIVTRRPDGPVLAMTPGADKARPLWAALQAEGAPAALDEGQGRPRIVEQALLQEGIVVLGHMDAGLGALAARAGAHIVLVEPEALGVDAMRLVDHLAAEAPVHAIWAANGPMLRDFSNDAPAPADWRPETVANALATAALYRRRLRRAILRTEADAARSLSVAGEPD